MMEQTLVSRNIYSSTFKEARVTPGSPPMHRFHLEQLAFCVARTIVIKVLENRLWYVESTGCLAVLAITPLWYICLTERAWFWENPVISNLAERGLVARGTNPFHQLPQQHSWCGLHMEDAGDTSQDVYGFPRCSLTEHHQHYRDDRFPPRSP